MSFWFAPANPRTLATCRILFFGAFFLFYLREDFSAWSGVSRVFWIPLKPFQWLHLTPCSSGVTVILQRAWKLSLLLACVGLLTPVAGTAAFLLGFYLLGLPNNFGGVRHTDTIVVLTFGIMALSRCGDSLSLDVLLARRKGRKNIPDSGEYRWPVRAVWLLFSMIFLAAGLSKLKVSGLDWVTTSNAQNRLIWMNYGINDAASVTLWGLSLATHPGLCKLLAAGTLLLELSYPLALFSKPLRWVIVPGVFVMQIAIRILLGPSFGQFLICNLFWIPWDRLLPSAFGPSTNPVHATLNPTNP